MIADAREKRLCDALSALWNGNVKDAQAGLSEIADGHPGARLWLGILRMASDEAGHRALALLRTLVPDCVAELPFGACCGEQSLLTRVPEATAACTDEALREALRSLEECGDAGVLFGGAWLYAGERYAEAERLLGRISADRAEVSVVGGAALLRGYCRMCQAKWARAAEDIALAEVWYGIRMTGSWIKILTGLSARRAPSPGWLWSCFAARRVRRVFLKRLGGSPEAAPETCRSAFFDRLVDNPGDVLGDVVGAQEEVFRKAASGETPPAGRRTLNPGPVPGLPQSPAEDLRLDYLSADRDFRVAFRRCQEASDGEAFPPRDVTGWDEVRIGAYHWQQQRLSLIETFLACIRLVMLWSLCGRKPGDNPWFPILATWLMDNIGWILRLNDFYLLADRMDADVMNGVVGKAFAAAVYEPPPDGVSLFPD